MGDREFEKFVRDLTERIRARAYDPTLLAQALGYPWERPSGSYLLTDAGVELIEAMATTDRARAVERFCSGDSGRVPVLSIGSNAAPEVLARKFAHFPREDDRAVLALSGRLHDFDVGASAHLTLYGAMPATLFPSPGTMACATVIWITPVQFIQLAWSELNYRLGSLRAHFDADEGSSFDEVLVFVSRFGTFCVDNNPIALAAIPATGRTADTLTQEQLLDAAATLAIGAGAKAEAIVRAIFEELSQIGPKIAATVSRETQPFASERWTPFNPASPPAGARSTPAPG
jgi:hypothetical protein